MKFVVKENDEEYEFLLGEGVYIVGRHPTCDLVLRSGNISRRHMSCTVGKSEIKVEDLGSRNGIYVGGTRVRSALVKPGQRIKLGDVKLKLKASGQGTMAAAPTQTEPVEGQVSVEDEEQTPLDESVLPATTDGQQTHIVQRDGKWFAVDAASGTEVEIVPAGKKKSKPLLKRLLPNRRIRIAAMIGAAVVGILFAAAIYKSYRDAHTPRISGAKYKSLMDGAIRALDANNSVKARSLAQNAAAGRPDRQAPGILVELADLWEPWQKDFLGHWQKVNRRLEELKNRYNSDACREFVQEYTEWTDRQLSYFAAYNDAKSKLQAGEYEAAFLALHNEGIPEGAMVRQQKAAFFRQVEKQLEQHIDRRIEDAVSARDWSEAATWAEKMVNYFPDESESTDRKLNQYRQYAEDKRDLDTAGDRIREGRFSDALKVLDRIEKDSPHQDQATQLKERARGGMVCQEALSFYHRGRAEEALDMLGGKDHEACALLRDHIGTVLDAYRSATQAEGEHELAQAEQLWEGLVSTQESFFGGQHAQFPSDTLLGQQNLGENSYYREAKASLGNMDERKAQLARQLVEKGKRLTQAEEFAEAKRCYEKARRMDPGRRIGAEALKQLYARGRRDYWSALVYEKKDPERALELLDRACELLPPEDDYYTLAVEKRKEVKEKLEASENKEQE